MGYDKKSKARKALAIKHTLNAMLDGATYSVLLANLQEDVYNLDYKYSLGGANRIVTCARKVFRDDYNEELKGLKERLVNMYFDLYTEAKSIGQHQSALKALEQLTKLTGLNEPDKKEVTIKDITVDFGFNKED